jgi:hypothetical protein
LWTLSTFLLSKDTSHREFVNPLYSQAQRRDPAGRKRPRLAKIAVCGEHAEPDCTSSPQPAIFDQEHQECLVNEVICPAYEDGASVMRRRRTRALAI